MKSEKYKAGVKKNVEIYLWEEISFQEHNELIVTCCVF